MSLRRKPLFRLCVVASVVAALAACSTQKAKWANITFHNTTAHYNVWWNGNESLKEGIAKLDRTAKDDYTRILSPQRIGTKEEAMAVNPEMDRAIEKGVKGIRQHSIFVHGEEHVPYVRKCYLLTAQASFYKRDLVTAVNTCQMIQSQYAGTEVADEAAIIQARCATADNQYAEAEAALDALVVRLGKGSFSRGLTADLYMAMLEALLPQAKYKKAVKFAQMALEAGLPRQTQARVYFILGQVYQQAGKRAKASDYYQLCISKNNEYTLDFNARLSLASCADLKHTDLPRLERQLDRMLDDRKNVEFKDQIYYAKGEMYMGVKDAKKACDNFALSVTAAADHPSQRARAALRMGEIQYEVYENYDLAQLYYDTAMSVIDADYPNYKEIRARHTLLTSLTRYTRQVALNDSLLYVASLSTAERDSLIAKKIADLKAEEAAAAERALMEELASQSNAQRNVLQGDWYFYNHNTVQQGSQTFRQRWGDRTLEDYWFLARKGMLALGNMIAGAEGFSSSDAADTLSDGDTDGSQTGRSAAARQKGNPDDPHNPAYYLKNLPSTAQQRDSMRVATALALLNAGYIYYDGIKNIERALECYLRMTNQYPDRDEIAQAFYMLYRIYSRQGNTPNADYYRNMVLRGFPDSDYANLIRDENYYKQLVNREQAIDDSYNELFETYRRGRYRNVVRLARETAETYPGNPAIDRFRYFEALSLARMDSVPKAISVLEKVVAQRDQTDTIVSYARSLLQYLRDGGTVQGRGDGAGIDIADGDNLSALSPQTVSQPDATAQADQLSPEAQMFRYKDNLQHYVIIVVNDKRIRATELQYRIADFNSQYYSNRGYRVNPLMFTDTTQLITIHRFVNADEAMVYYTHLLQPESPLAGLNRNDYVIFPISTQNYATFYNRKKVDAYREFFERYYKK